MIFCSLQAAYKEWANFRICHRLFFKHESFGPGGNNKDTASGDEDAAPGGADHTGKGKEEGKHSDSDNDSNNDNEPGKKPARSTTRRRTLGQADFLDTFTKLQQQSLSAEAEREEQRKRFDEKMEMERKQWEERKEMEHRAWEDRREREREEREERRERERREYEENKEEEREARANARLQLDREFNATLLAQLFPRKD